MGCGPSHWPWRGGEGPPATHVSGPVWERDEKSQKNKTKTKPNRKASPDPPPGMANRSPLSRAPSRQAPTSCCRALSIEGGAWPRSRRLLPPASSSRQPRAPGRGRDAPGHEDLSGRPARGRGVAGEVSGCRRGVDGESQAALRSQGRHTLSPRGRAAGHVEGRAGGVSRPPGPRVPRGTRTAGSRRPQSCVSTGRHRWLASRCATSQQSSETFVWLVLFKPSRPGPSPRAGDVGTLFSRRAVAGRRGK